MIKKLSKIIKNDPKITKHKKKIAESVANALNISESLISIKATTTNGLKFLDMENGWGAEVIVTVEV